MPPKMTVEELLLDESFVDHCFNKNSVYRSKWDQLRMADPEQAALMDEAQKLLAVIGPQLPGEEVAAEIEKLRRQLATQPGRSMSKRKTIRRIGLSVSVAACIVIALFFIWSMPGKTTEPVAITEHETGLGQRKQIQLPDGSTVILNSNSHLSYTTDFNKKERRLQLAGEAYFEVAKDHARKFIVSSDHFSTTAIGTAFYVHARQPGQSYAVDLLEGKVNLQHLSATPVLLEAGSAASWAAGNNGFDKNSFDTASLRQWISGRLAFQQVQVGDVFQHLQKWYGVEIEDTRKKLGAISITGDYTDKPLEDILKAICFSLSCNYTINGNRITIQ
jgi:transmembrane sensor